MTRKTRIVALSVLIFGSLAGVTALASAKGKGKHRDPAARIERVFEKHDTNKDGKLTESEVGERKWKRLSKADANNDNAVTKAELEQKMAERKAKRGERKGKRGEGKRGEGKGKRGERRQKAAE
ncbi:MAG: hypothetical protein R3B89_31590 [Polyangiaceae bacterium]